MTTTGLHEGTLIDVDGRPTLRFERRYSHPLERIWRAVTEPDELAAWFPSGIVGERAVGAPLQFPFEEGEAPTFQGTVLAFDPPREFAFDWNGEILRFELSRDGAETVLVFTHALGHQSIAARNGSGWDFCLANLSAHLGAGAPPAPDGWKDVYDDYLRRMGPEIARVTDTVSLTWDRAHHVDAARIWECLTDPFELEAWMEHPVTIEPRLGGRIRFDFHPHGDPVEGVIVVFEPEQRLAYTFGGVSVVEWQVESVPHGTRYSLSQHGLPPGGDTPGMGAGWHAFLVQLDMYVAAGQVVNADAEMERLTPAYEELLRRR